MTREMNRLRFSKRAIKSSVRSSSLNHPLTLFPSALGALGVFGGSLFSAPLVIAAGMGGLVFGVGHFVTKYFIQFDNAAREHMKALHTKMIETLEARPERLKEEFQDVGFDRGLQQLNMAKIKFDEFLDALGRKFNKSELTFGRYSGVSEAVYLSILDNLELAVAKLRSIRSINPEYINAQLDEVRNRNNDTSEIEALNARLQLRDAALREIDAILAENERAMTTLDKTALRVASIQTQKNVSVKDADIAMQELELLATRAVDYEGK